MVRLLFASGDRGERERFRKAAMERTGVSLAGIARDGQEAIQMAVQYHPAVAVLAEDLPVFDGVEAAAVIAAAAPGTKVVLLADGDSPGVQRAAMRAGVRERAARRTDPAAVLDLAAEVGDLDRVRDRPEYAAALDPKRFPQIVAVTGAKGGIGKTTTTVNLAIELARSGYGPTCLVDLYTQFGDVATVLNAKPHQTLVDLVEAREIDPESLEAATWAHPSGLHVLLGSRSMEALDALPLVHLERVFAALRQRYRFIVVDVPNFLHAGTIRVLENAHQLLLICNLMDLTAVTDTRRFLEAIEDSVLPRERIRLVLTRVCKESHMPVEAVERAVGMAAWARVPNDFQLVSRCANKGVPFVLEAPKSPVSMAIQGMARSLVHDTEGSPIAVPEPAGRRAFSFLSRNGAVPVRDSA